MEEFLNKNPGLRSRIAFHVNFDDYSTDELIDIADLMIKKRALSLPEKRIKSSVRFLMPQEKARFRQREICQELD